jgi:L-ribulose-5-phosphate 3-epimerase
MQVRPVKTDHHKLTRRALLKQSAQAAMFAAAASSFQPLFAAPGSRWFKIGACDWSLGKQCDPAAFQVAKQIGLDGVQISMGVVANHMHLRRPEMRQKYVDAARQSGLEIASLAIGEMNQVPLKSDPRAAHWLSDSIDICKAMGLTVTMPACFASGDLDMRKTSEIDHVVGVLKDVAPKAEKQGITIGIENYLSADDNRRILDRVGSPALKVYYDVGNSTDKGRDVYKEIRSLGKLICEFHAKDAQYMLGHGRIDFRKVRQAMDDIDYSGWIQLEATAPHGIVPDYTADRKYLKSLFPKTV